MKKYILILPFIIWTLLVLLEWWSLLFQKEKPMYFRAWEYTVNEGQDTYKHTYKPLVTYNGILQGDLLRLPQFNFTPRKDDIYAQLFITDEYGFRNKPGLLKKNVEAVLVGTSFVVGAHATQEHLVNTLLTEKYQIPTYNFGNLPLQHFWEDSRFIKKPPQYLVLLVNEVEIIPGGWIDDLNETENIIEIQKWDNFEQWDESQNQFVWSVDNVQNFTKRWSILRYISQQELRQVINIAPRKFIAFEQVEKNAYDPATEMLFLDIDLYDPRYNTNSQNQIKKEIEKLKRTQNILEKRNISLVVATMPSKASLHSKLYASVPVTEKTLFHFEKEMEKNNILHIKLAEDMDRIVKTEKKDLYYTDDTHWNALANAIIARKLAILIQQQED